VDLILRVQRADQVPCHVLIVDANFDWMIVTLLSRRWSVHSDWDTFCFVGSNHIPSSEDIASGGQITFWDGG
jgi:hypothetical protein